MTQVGAWISGLTGWRRLLFAFTMGAMSATAFAPLEFFPALLLGYAALVLLMDGADGTESLAEPKRGNPPAFALRASARQPPRVARRLVRRAALGGWAFCFGQFLVGWHWIGYAFLVDPTNHLWQMPFALVSLTAGLALYGALACGLAAVFWRKGTARLFIFAIAMAGGEWLRGHLFTGFPWNLSAYGWGASLELLQSASLMGAYGLSFLTILFGASLADSFNGRWRALLCMTLLFAGLWCFGVYRLANTPTADVPGVELRLVQPDIPQAEKYVRRLMVRNWLRLIDLSARPGRPTIIVWPEAATGFAVACEPGALDEIGLFTARGQTIITGSDRVPGCTRRAAYNSLYLFGPRGALPEVYDKFHLVPFGEYVPFARILNRIGITQLTVGEGFSSGDHPHLLAVSGAPPVSPLICYEVIFPHEVTDAHAPRPGWFVNITDDSWFGPWAGPKQHFLTARVRAIEEGLPIVRDANTGITGVIDGNGRVRAELGLNRLGIVDATLPVALRPTFYARFGDLIFLLFLVTAAFASLLTPRM